MNFFPRRQQRKIHPCSLFKRKSSSNDDFHRRRNTNSNVSENQNLDENPREEINESNSMLLDDKQIKQSRALARANAAAISKKRKKASTPEKNANRRQNLEHAFNQRRDAVRKEIERTWFVEGASLQIHRRNLKFTHELRKR